MKIVIATRYLPWPLNEGGKVAQHRVLEAMQSVCSFTMIVPVFSAREEEEAREFSRIFPNITLESVRCFEPQAKPSFRSCLRKVLGSIFRSIFRFGKNSPDQTSTNPSSEVEPYDPFYSLPRPFVEAVDRLIKSGCDLLQADFADMLTLGPLINGRLPTLFVHHQLHYVYVKRFLEINRLPASYARYLLAKMITEEASYLAAFDSVIVFSEVDRQALSGICPRIPIDVSPFPTPEEPLATAIQFKESIHRFVFLGSDSHPSNLDGLKWFMKDIWPIVKRGIPEALIEVIGQWSQKGIDSLNHAADIHFLGFVPNLISALQNRIMIVPILIGSGIRTKILAAWSASCPVITTTVGVEGLPGKSGEHFLAVDDPDNFGKVCVDLAGDIELLNRISKNALELVKREFSLKATCKKRLEIYQNAVARYSARK